MPGAFRAGSGMLTLALTLSPTERVFCRLGWPARGGMAVRRFMLLSGPTDWSVSGVEKRTFDLPPEQAGYIDTLVSSGAYSSPSEVVRAGLRALQERHSAVERWLHEDVVNTYDAMLADPSRAMTTDQVTAAVRAHHAKRLKT